MTADTRPQPLTIAESGSGPTVLVLHGGAGPASVAGIAEHLSRTFHVLMPTHSGWNGTPLRFDGIGDLARAYLDLLRERELRDVFVIGSSIGGWIAAEMATKVPERVGKLVMAGPVGVKVGSPDKLDIPDIFALPHADVQKLMYHDPARMAPDTRKMTDDELAAMFRNRETLALMVWEPWMHNTKLKRRLHRVKAPALFIRGASDGLVSDAYLKAYAGLLPNARTLTIPAAGHAPHLEQPEAFTSAVLEFLGA